MVLDFSAKKNRAQAEPVPGKIEAGHDFWGKSAVLLIKERSHVESQLLFYGTCRCSAEHWYDKSHSLSDFSGYLTCQAGRAIHEVWGNMYGLLPVWGAGNPLLIKYLKGGQRPRERGELRIFKYFLGVSIRTKTSL